jgi:hypothetical protein
MQTMFIVRLLNAEREVLAWNKIPAETKGDGGLWALQQFVAEVDTNGVGTAICFHWPDVHVYQTRPLAQPLPVEVGKVITVPIMETPMIHIRSEPLPLPGVTVKQSVTVGLMPAGR